MTIKLFYFCWGGFKIPLLKWRVQGGGGRQGKPSGIEQRAKRNENANWERAGNVCGSREKKNEGINVGPPRSCEFGRVARLYTYGTNLQKLFRGQTILPMLVSRLHGTVVNAYYCQRISDTASTRNRRGPESSFKLREKRKIVFSRLRKLRQPVERSFIEIIRWQIKKKRMYQSFKIKRRFLRSYLQTNTRLKVISLTDNRRHL